MLHKLSQFRLRPAGWAAWSGARAPDLLGWHWLAIYSAIVGAWVLIFLQSVPAGSLEIAANYGIDFWLGLCAIAPTSSGYIELVSMWLLMAVAMMLPTVMPALATYDQLSSTGAGRKLGLLELSAGFLVVWFGFSLVMAGIQTLFAEFLSLAADSSAPVGWQAIAVLTAAGIYQFLPAKDACLARCRSPFMLFMAHWRESPLNEFSLGIRMGAICVGCCWLLMAISLISGAMGLLWMGLATVLMCLEKLPELGRLVTRPLGLALIGLAACLAATI